jgi:hypothetical protein
VAALLTGYRRTNIADIEVGRRQAGPLFWARVDDLFGAGGTLVKARQYLDELRQARDEARGPPCCPTCGGPVPTVGRRRDG